MSCFHNIGLRKETIGFHRMLEQTKTYIFGSPIFRLMSLVATRYDTLKFLLVATYLVDTLTKITETSLMDPLLMVRLSKPQRVPVAKKMKFK